MSRRIFSAALETRQEAALHIAGQICPFLASCGQVMPSLSRCGSAGSQWWELPGELALGVGQAAASFWAALRSRAPRRAAVREVSCTYAVQMAA